MVEQACRIAWKSLCDSRRYYRRKVGSKSDDNNLRDCDYSSDDSFAKPPPFEEEMKFLDYVEKTNLLSNKLSNPEMEEINQNGCMSPYSYINESINSTSQQTNCLNELIFDMVEVEDYKETKYDPNQSDHNPMTAEKREKTSQQYERSTIHITKRRRIEETDNGAFLIHLDSILNKLPLNLSEGLQAKMMTMAYQELARHRSS
ncbi:uncharacterized protein LOC142224122 isoform X2 [Haematobia irritans]|uniref:uncharacterized protein LOC142224122 isoform X2 n=1 Tax=Haematobia irritans TaxID=7368 RepID=UPI003F508723